MRAMKWYVYVHDFNKDRMCRYNIFEHGSFMKDIRENYKKNKNDKPEFLKRLKASLFYYFGTKCEWEIIISPWAVHGETREKIDVRDQIMQNWIPFSEYVWEMCHKRKAKGEEETREGYKKVSYLW